jgi:hypothetical protein
MEKPDLRFGVMNAERDSVEHRETANGALRALYLGTFADAGRRRAEALREADAQLDRLCRLLPNAVAAGIGIAEISRVADVSRPTLHKLLPRGLDKPRDIRLGVLQATLGGATAREISKIVRWPRGDVDGLLATFAERGWVQAADEQWYLSPKGVDAISSWDFDASIEEFIREYEP